MEKYGARLVDRVSELEERQMLEVVIRYVVSDGQIEKQVTFFEPLLGGYGIVRGLKEDIERLMFDPNVIYMELLEPFYFGEVENDVNTEQGLEEDYALSIKEISDKDRICNQSPGNESGKGVIMAYLDSGIDYRHPEFLDENGESRILAIYDLRENANIVYTTEDINQALLGQNDVPKVLDRSGHGTHVAAIGSGNHGVAKDSQIVMVALAQRGGATTASLMRGVDFCIKMAREKNSPIVINISLGNNDGAHNGTTLVEQYLDEMLNYAKASIVVGIGNEGLGTSHYQGKVVRNISEEVPFSVGEFQGEMTILIWRRITDQFTISLQSPKGERIQFGGVYEANRYQFSGEEVRVLVEGSNPLQISEVIRLTLLPKGNYVTQGIWNLTFETTQDEVVVDIWLPVTEALSKLTGFLQSSPDITLTVPSSANRVITVGALNTQNNQVADFSGRGNTWRTNQVKPDLVAPGVNVESAAIGGGYTKKSGTSMAAPFVSGAAAILMEWGIIKGNDPFLYGDKMKAYLHRGAKVIPQFDVYPNRYVGYGELCIRNSF